MLFIFFQFLSAMKGRYCFCFYMMAFLYVLCLVSAASRAHHQGQVVVPFQPSFDSSKQGLEKMAQVNDNEKANRGLRSVGSRPPNCEHKCGSCKPCIAVQVPANTGHLKVQYANYEPEGWKCKCGSAVSTP